MSADFALIVERVKAGSCSLVPEVPRMLAFVAEQDDVSVLSELKAQAVAVAAYLAQRKDGSVEEYNAALKVRARAEHRLGEVLAKTVRPGRRWLNSDTVSELNNVPDGVPPRQSSRAQQLAAVPWDEVEQAIDAATDRNERASLGRIVGGKRRERCRNGGAVEACTTDDLGKLVALGRKFGTVYADPPWQYGNQATRASTDNHYRTMTPDDIAALPVRDLAADAAHLHLWTTNAFLFDCPQIMEAWGFTYKSCFVWVKPQMGIGNYWRVSHEYLLLGVRGDLTFLDRSLMSWGQFDRTRHSAKPHEVRKLVELASPGPRLELFGRGVPDGWTVWGNEIPKDMFDQEVRRIG